MIALIQRVTQASVKVDDSIIGQIEHGLLILLGVEKEDNQAKADALLEKVLNLRIFADEAGKMNLNIQQANGSALVVSQFTLTADTKKGNRPGFSQGATPQLADELYQYLTKQCATKIPTATGKFGADMQVALVNDGPVTFWIQI